MHHSELRDLFRTSEQLTLISKTSHEDRTLRLSLSPFNKNYIVLKKEEPPKSEVNIILTTNDEQFTIFRISEVTPKRLRNKFEFDLPNN